MLISDAVARYRIEYDRGDLPAAIKDQAKFADATERGDKAMSDSAKESARYEAMFRDIEAGAKGASDGIDDAEQQSKSFGETVGSISKGMSGLGNEMDLLGVSGGGTLKNLGGSLGNMGEQADLAKGLVGNLSGGFEGLTAAINPGTLALGALALGGLAAGVAIAKGLRAGVVAVNDLQEAQNQATAKFGATAAEAEALGAVGREVWRNNWGESITDATIRAGTLKQVLGEVSDAALAEATQASFAFEQVFEKGVEDQNRAVQSLVGSFGDLEGSGTQALDLLTAGFQNGLNSQDDLIDTSNEYASFFSQMGFSAEEFFGILEQGMDAGARDTDKVADVFKEFQIRVMDGSTSTRDALASLGIDTELGAQMARGEVAFDEGFNQIQASLLSMDEASREQAGVALFGTQWEDTMRGIIDDIDLASAGLGVMNGAAITAGDAANNNLGAAWQNVKRSAVDALIPLLEPFVQMMKDIAIPALNAFAGKIDSLAQSEGFKVLVHDLGVIADLTVDAGTGFFNFLSKPIPGTNPVSEVKDQVAEAKQELGAFGKGWLEVKDFFNTPVPGNTYLDEVKSLEEAISADSRLMQNANNMTARFGETHIKIARSFDETKADALGSLNELGRGFQSWADSAGGVAESEEERSQRMASANEQLTSRIGASLADIWSLRTDFDQQFQDARDKDEQSQRNAQAAKEQGAAAHADKMAKLQEKLAGADGTERGKIEASISEEQRRWDGIVSVAQTGTDTAVAEVQERYDAERAAIRESLAQTVIDHTNAMVLMGDVSAETAKGVFQALAGAYPDVEIINPATEATLDFNETLNDVLEGKRDPEEIVTAIDNVESAMVELDDKNSESFGVAQETWEGHGIAAQAGGSVVVGSYGDVGAASSEASSTIDAEASASIKSAEKMGNGIQTGTAHAKSAMADAGETAKSAGSDIRASFTGVGKQIAQDGAAAARSLEDISAGGDSAARSIGELNAAAADAGDGTTSALDDGAQSAQDAASDLEDTADTVVDLGDAIEDLPSELQIDGDDALSLFDELDGMMDDLRSNADRGFVIHGRYEGKDGPSRARSPFALMGMIDDLRENADIGFSITGRIGDSTQGLLNTSSSSGGELEYERLLRRMSDADYEVVVRSRLEAGGLIAGINTAVGEARSLFDNLNLAHSKFFEGGAGDPNSLAAFLASGGEETAITHLPEQFDGLVSLLDSLPSMAHLLANPEARAEIEAMIEEQTRLWDRFVEDLSAAEDARHETLVKNIDDESERGEQAADDALDRINRLLAIRRAGNTGANEDGEVINLKKFSEEIERVAQMMFDLGLIPEASKPALEAYYSSMTDGVNTQIERSDQPDRCHRIDEGVLARGH